MFKIVVYSWVLILSVFGRVVQFLTGPQNRLCIGTIQSDLILIIVVSCQMAWKSSFKQCPPIFCFIVLHTDDLLKKWRQFFNNWTGILWFNDNSWMWRKILEEMVPLLFCHFQVIVSIDLFLIMQINVYPSSELFKHILLIINFLYFDCEVLWNIPRL